MTKSSTSRRIRRQQRRKIAEEAHRKANQLTPEQAREKLAKWAAAGGDLKYLMDHGRVRYATVPSMQSLRMIAAHPEAQPVMITSDGVDVIQPPTISELKEKYR